MSDHQRYLEAPYVRQEEIAEADAAAREQGYEDADEMWESMREEAAERNAEIRADLEYEDMMSEREL